MRVTVYYQAIERGEKGTGELSFDLPYSSLDKVHKEFGKILTGVVIGVTIHDNLTLSIPPSRIWKVEVRKNPLQNPQL